MAKRDYYDVLGVNRSATDDEIKRAYRKLARQYHPDVNKDPKAPERFGEVQEAYDALSEPGKRKQYDQYGHLPPGVSPEMYESYRRAQQSGGPRGGPGPRTVSPEDFEFGAGTTQFGDVFDQLFGQRGPFNRQGGRRRHPGSDDAQRGPDVEYPVTLTFAQAARGTALSLQVNRGGAVEPLEFKIPAGVRDGQRVRVKGKGGHDGGTPGDLFVVISVTPHPFFRRDGLDITLDVPLSLYEALLGARLEVPTLDGPVTITIPPGTSSGAKLRIKGRGVKRGAEQGDQFCLIKIVVPKDLTDQEQAFVHDMQARHPLSPRKDVGW
jgi:DnaJ-class molecular chaperone